MVQYQIQQFFTNKQTQHSSPIFTHFSMEESECSWKMVFIRLCACKITRIKFGKLNQLVFVPTTSKVIYRTKCSHAHEQIRVYLGLGTVRGLLVGWISILRFGDSRDWGSRAVRQEKKAGRALCSAFRACVHREREGGGSWGGWWVGGV